RWRTSWSWKTTRTAAANIAISQMRSISLTSLLAAESSVLPGYRPLVPAATSLGSAKAAALVMRAEELGRAGGVHRGRRGDLERERRRRHDLGEAVDVAGAGAAHQLEPAPRAGARWAAADGRPLQAR